MLGHIIPEMLGTTGRANFARAGHTKKPHHRIITSVAPTTLHFSAWKNTEVLYRSVCTTQIPGQGKGLSEDFSSITLIERRVVNCLCVGGEKSICFLTAVTSRPWGWETGAGRHMQTHRQTHTHTHTETHVLLCQTKREKKIPKPCPASINLHTQTHPSSTGACTRTRTCTLPSTEEEDVHGVIESG